MESGFHKRNAILIAIVCFVCMLIGSFYDYQISSAYLIQIAGLEFLGQPMDKCQYL